MILCRTQHCRQVIDTVANGNTHLRTFVSCLGALVEGGVEPEGEGVGGPKIPPRTDNRWGDIPFTYLLDSSSQLVSLEEEDEHHLVHLLTLSERREGRGGEGSGGEGRGGEGRGRR